MLRAAILITLLLAACGTPEQRCQKAATRDLKTVNTLIAESEANIARGYRYENELRPVRVGIGFCSGGTIRFCGSNDTDVVRRPVAIDTNEERRKLESLKAKRAQLETSTYAATRACVARAQGVAPL